MHTRNQYLYESIEVEIDGRPSDIESLTPNYQLHDRFGMVINQTLGTFGATILIQIAVENFYRVKPSRRDTAPEYPEIYLFHEGGAYGDHSNFDFWPFRKEIFVRGGDPVEMLAAINTCAITRLAIPDGPVADLEHLEAGVNTWSDIRSATERLVSCFAYSADGQTANSDVILRSSHPNIEDNVLYTLDPLAYAKPMIEAPEESFLEGLPPLSKAPDLFRWVNLTGERLHEISDDLRATMASERAARIAQNNGYTVETHRRITTAEALGMISATALRGDASSSEPSIDR